MISCHNVQWPLISVLHTHTNIDSSHTIQTLTIKHSIRVCGSHLGEHLKMDLADVEFWVRVHALQSDLLSLENRLSWPLNEQSGCMWTEVTDAGYWSHHEYTGATGVKSALTSSGEFLFRAMLKKQHNLFLEFVSSASWKHANMICQMITWPTTIFLLTSWREYRVCATYCTRNIIYIEFYANTAFNMYSM